MLDTAEIRGGLRELVRPGFPVRDILGEKLGFPRDGVRAGGGDERGDAPEGGGELRLPVRDDVSAHPPFPQSMGRGPAAVTAAGQSTTLKSRSAAEEKCVRTVHPDWLVCGPWGAPAFP